MAKNDKITTFTTPAPTTETAIALPQGGGVVRAADARTSQALFADLALAPAFVTLEAGDAISGLFVRWGSIESKEERTDKLTGVITRERMRTLVIRTADGDFEILSAHEINRCLGTLGPDQSLKMYIAIQRGQDRRVGTNMVTDYKIGARPAAAAS